MSVKKKQITFISQIWADFGPIKFTSWNTYLWLNIWYIFFKVQNLTDRIELIEFKW